MHSASMDRMRHEAGSLASAGVSATQSRQDMPWSKMTRLERFAYRARVATRHSEIARAAQVHVPPRSEALADLVAASKRYLARKASAPTTVAADQPQPKAVKTGQVVGVLAERPLSGPRRAIAGSRDTSTP